MIPVSNKTRSVTRVRYKHQFSSGKKIPPQFLQQPRAACAVLNMFVCRVSLSDADVKTRLNVESSRGETIETKPAALLHRSLRRHHRPDHLHRPNRCRPRYLYQIAA